MANKLVNVNGKFVMQREVPTSPSRLGPTKIKEALNKTAQQKKAAQSSGSVPYASPIAKNMTMDTSPRNYGKPVTEKVQIVDYQSPIDTSPRNYGRPVTNKPHLGLYDDEKSLSNVTLGDVTYKPLLSGYYGQKMNEAIGVNRLSGNTNMNTPQIAKYQGLAKKFEPTRFSNPNAPFGGMLNNAPQGAMSLIGQQVANLTDEDTVMYAGTGAAAGAMAGSVAGLPGSAITAATGFTAGITAGVGKNMFEAVYGGTYRDLMDAGVSDSTAHKTALISAGVQSALEMAQLDELAKAAKLLRRQNKAVLAEGIEKILIDRGKGVLKNTAEEVAQEAVAMGFEYDAKKLEGLPTDSWQDNVKRAGQTAIDSALSFGLMSLPGAVSTGNQALQYDKDQKRAQEYIDSLKVAMIKNGITPRSEQPQGTLGPLAAQAANQTPLNSTLITPQDLGNAAIADAKNNWTPGQVRYQNNLYTPPGREKTMTAERKEQSRRQAIQYAKRANIDIVFRDLEEGEGHFEGKFEKYDGKNILNPKGRITINNNSYDPFRVVFIHEFTHAMELSKEHYNKYANFAIVNLLPYKYGTSDIAELADAKAKYYASRGVRLTAEEARQEIVSELTSEYMFRDYQAIENLFRYNENIFYWMFENIKNWVKSFAGTQEEQDLARAYKLYARVLKEHQKRPNVVKAAQESDADNDNAQNAAQEGDTQVAASYLLTDESAERDNTVPYSGISNDAKLSMKKAVSSRDDINYSPDGEMMFDEGSIGEVVKSDTDKDLGGDEAIVKFSLKEPVEKTKDLIAAHNLTIDNMMKTLDLGGLPAASIAVAKADMGHSEFGEISVLFYPDTIDGKKNKANKVFAGDAWTQTFPQISQKVSKQAHERLEKRIDSLLADGNMYRDLGPLNLSYSDVQGEVDGRGSFVDAYRNSGRMKLAFLRDTGKEFKPVMMEKTFIEDKPVMKAMLQIIGADKAKEGFTRDELMSYEPQIRDAINKYYRSVTLDTVRYDKPMTWAEMDRTVNSLRQYAYYIEDGSPKVMDTRKTKDKLNKTVNEKAYTKWLESISEGLIEKQGVRNSKDPYTNNGRRTWDQLHDDATLENITKAMTSKDLTGNSFSGGTKFAAGVKKQLGSISDIKKNKDLIKDVSDEEIKAIRDDIDKRLIELVDTINGDSDSLFARDGVIDSLLDVALKGKTRDGIKRRLMATQYGNIDKSKLTDKVVDDFVQLIQDAQAVPTRYFEAKPQRAIGLDEIAMVVIPRKGTKELRAALDARGISYKMYDGTAEDRIAKINGVPDVKFSLKKTDAKNIARKIKADYGSKSTIKDISQELTEIYDMDVNDMMAVNQRIEQLAARIAENVPTVNEFEQRIKEFRQAVRNMPIRVDDNIKADIADFGAWSKRYFNRLNLSADGRNIDELYGSLAEQFPDFLESDIDNPTDQLMSIAEALDTTRQDKGYSNNKDMMYDILLDIYDDYYRYQADEQAKAAEEPIFEPGDDGPGNNGPTDDGDGYGEYDGDTSLVRTDVWEHTEPEDRSPYFEKGENPARDINVPQRDEYGRKVSRFTRTAAESRALDDNQASELNESVWNGTFSYNVITDQDAINRANDKMERFDNDTLLNGLESKLYDSKIITKDDIALGERLIQEYAKEKNTENLERAIAVVATAGTRAGQAVQAMRLLKKLSPAGQLMALQKQIDTINTDMKLLGDNKVTLSPERAKDITSSDTPEGLEQAVERAKMELYNKVPSKWVDKWNAWRYLSMLGNPKTHIRNMFSNVIFVPVKGMKNVIGASIEAATVKGERSKAIGKLPKVFKEFAAKEFDENKEAIDAGGKENIERNKRVFKSSLLEGMRKANSFALEAEDQKFLKAAYIRSFAGYLKANKISPALVQKLMSGKGADIEIGDAATAKIFNNARAYAMNEAQKATYRDYSALANALNKFKKTNAVTAVLGEGLMPFTKTPINILKRGVEYSPAGILKGIKELTNDVRKADEDMKQQTIIKGIDSMASGLSGTAILALGAFLASQGILSGGGEEDKKERDMAAMMGSQNYSFSIGDVSYTVDWMAPVSLPLFVGVELFNSLESGTVNGFVDIVDAMTSISEPMVNMSMLQGLNRAVTNYDQKGALTSTAADMALGYFSQGVPTLGGQIARTMDATRRTAYVDKNNDIPDTLERPMLNAAAKVPGLSKKLNPYRDSFGRAQTNDSALMRAFENFISPGYVKVKKDDKVLNELQKVYGRTGDKGVLPSLPNKKIGDKDLTAKEYDRMADIKGKESYELINDIRKSDAYKDLSASDQAKMINDVYSYAYAKAKDDVLGIKPDGWIAKALDAEKKHDIPVETYITYNNYKNSLEGAGTKAKFIDKIQSDESLTQNQKDKLDDYWYGSVEASKITELSTAEQRQWNVAKNYGFDEEKFSKYVGYITQQGEGKTKMNNINDAVKAGLPRGEAVLLYNIMRQKKYRYNG